MNIQKYTNLVSLIHFHQFRYNFTQGFRIVLIPLGQAWDHVIQKILINTAQKTVVIEPKVRREPGRWGIK